MSNIQGFPQSYPPPPPQGSIPQQTGGYDTSAFDPQQLPPQMPPQAPQSPVPPQGDPTGGIPTSQSFLSHLNPRNEGGAPPMSSNFSNLIGDPTQFSQRTEQINQENSQTTLIQERAQAMGDQVNKFKDLAGSLTGILDQAAQGTKQVAGGIK